MKVLKNDTEFQHSWYKTYTVPKGTPVRPATNLPDKGLYWVEVPEDANDQVRSWMEVYGFLADEGGVMDKPLPDHLFVGDSGHMYNTRRFDWANHPLRHNYARPARDFPPTPEGSIALRASIRNPYAWPGGYEMIFWTEDGGCLCHRCVRDNYRLIAEERRNYGSGWRVLYATLDCEEETDGYDLTCDQCNKVLVQHEGEDS